MPDVFTKAKRSEVMSRIRSRGNRDTELALAKLLRAHGITGWRRHVEIRGRDVALRRLRPVQGRNEGVNKSGNLPAGLRIVGTRGHRSAMSLPRVASQHASRSAQRANPTKPFCVRPDFVFIKSRTAIFVDGCFWHGCPQHGTKPKNNAAFWRKKIAANKRRDVLVTRTLRKAGWRVLRIWEHALRRANQKRLVVRLARVIRRRRGLH